jgi:NAD(P)-dependent dehydrogenase (short-subunit alcohol dehydrogenase family)
MDLKNQIAIVTGGTRGLGLGIVEELVDHGAQVTVVARQQADCGRCRRGSPSLSEQPAYSRALKTS